jgi:ribosomal protein L14E/L6E/L27E
MIYTKLLEVQKEIGAIKKNSTNPFFKSKYFDINSLLEHVKPVLNKHGLVLMQGLSHIDGKLALETVIHVNTDKGTTFGEGEIKYVCPLPEVLDAQKAGSAITYFRRYALQSLLALEAEDDDAETDRIINKPKEMDKAIKDLKNNFKI